MGGARQRRSPGPRALAVVALAALAVGLLAGRASAPGPQRDSKADTGPGPRAVLAGVGVGHARTPKGAAAAVASYQRAFADPAILDAQVMRRRVGVMASPDYARAVLAANAPGRERLARGPVGVGVAQGVRTLYRSVPIGYRIESFTPRRARVLTWGFTLLGNAASVEPRAYFGLARTDLIWREGDWKIAGSEAGFGPTPPLATPRGPLGGFGVMALTRRLRSYGATP